MELAKFLSGTPWTFGIAAAILAFWSRWLAGPHVNNFQNNNWLAEGGKGGKVANAEGKPLAVVWSRLRLLSWSRRSAAIMLYVTDSRWSRWLRCDSMRIVLAIKMPST